MTVEALTTWHYAVWKGKEIDFMWPACTSRGTLGLFQDLLIKHGMTVVRGNVSCVDCLKIMGPS